MSRFSDVLAASGGKRAHHARLARTPCTPSALTMHAARPFSLFLSPSIYLFIDGPIYLLIDEPRIYLWSNGCRDERLRARRRKTLRLGSRDERRKTLGAAADNKARRARTRGGSGAGADRGDKRLAFGGRAAATRPHCLHARALDHAARARNGVRHGALRERGCMYVCMYVCMYACMNARRPHVTISPYT